MKRIVIGGQLKIARFVRDDYRVVARNVQFSTFVLNGHKPFGHFGNLQDIIWPVKTIESDDTKRSSQTKNFVLFIF